MAGEVDRDAGQHALQTGLEFAAIDEPGQRVVRRAVTHLLAQATLFGHVVEHQHGAVMMAAGVEDRRRRVLDAVLAAVPRRQHGPMREPRHLALAQAQRDGVHDRFARLLVDDHEHLQQRPADRLGLEPSGQPLGDGVEPQDAPVVVGRDDGVADRLQRHLQHLAAVAQRLLGLLPARDVLERADQPHRPAVLVLDLADRAGPERPALRRDQRQLEVPRRPRLDALPHRVRDQRPHRRGVVRDGFFERGTMPVVDLVHATGLVRPRDLVGRQVHLPSADARDLARALDEALAGLQPALGRLQLRLVGNEAVDADDPRLFVAMRHVLAARVVQFAVVAGERQLEVGPRSAERRLQRGLQPLVDLVAVDGAQMQVGDLGDGPLQPALVGAVVEAEVVRVVDVADQRGHVVRDRAQHPLLVHDGQLRGPSLRDVGDHDVEADDGALHVDVGRVVDEGVHVAAVHDRHPLEGPMLAGERGPGFRGDARIAFVAEDLLHRPADDGAGAGAEVARVARVGESIGQRPVDVADQRGQRVGHALVEALDLPQRLFAVAQRTTDRRPCAKLATHEEVAADEQQSEQRLHRPEQLLRGGHRRVGRRGPSCQQLPLACDQRGRDAADLVHQPLSVAVPDDVERGAVVVLRDQRHGERELLQLGFGQVVQAESERLLLGVAPDAQARVVELRARRVDAAAIGLEIEGQTRQQVAALRGLRIEEAARDALDRADRVARMRRQLGGVLHVAELEMRGDRDADERDRAAEQQVPDRPFQPVARLRMLRLHVRTPC